MSYARKNAIFATAIWAMILAGLIVLVLGLGVQQFTEPDHWGWRLLAALIILPGFLANAWLGLRTKWGSRTGELDERDEAIGRQASQATLIVLAVVVYLTSILLYEFYSDVGSVPTAWLYLLAYGTLALVYLAHGLATLIIDWTGATSG